MITGQVFTMTEDFDACEMQVIQSQIKSSIDINLCDGLKNKNNMSTCRQMTQMKLASPSTSVK